MIPRVSSFKPEAKDSRILASGPRQTGAAAEADGANGGSGYGGGSLAGATGNLNRGKQLGDELASNGGSSDGAGKAPGGGARGWKSAGAALKGAG